MEIGVNVNPASKKGSRSYGRLRNLKSKLQILFSGEFSLSEEQGSGPEV